MRSAGGSSESSGSAEPPPTDAQRRHPRPGTGTGNRGSSGGSPPDSILAYEYEANDGSLPANYGYSPFDYAGRFGYAPDYFRNRSRRGGSLRLFVDPGSTAVFVDGYYAGTANELNGTVQRLFLSPGYHEIALVHDGYRTHGLQVYVSPGHVIDLRHAMEGLDFRQH